MQDINKIKEAFYKEFTIERTDSEGLTFKEKVEPYLIYNLENWIEQNLKKAYQRGVDDTIKRNNQNAPIGSTCDDTPIMKTYN